MLGTIDDFTIMRLRVKGSNLDPLAVRPRLQNLIGEISLRGLLPESASLFIRKLEDPAPGVLKLEAIDSRANRAWQRSLNSRFAHLVGSAARPARGPVSSNAESVVFLDYSELLACLAADWCNGFVGARWWWHSFLQRGDIGHVIKKLWREKIEYVPAAMQQLAKTQVLVEFVRVFSDRESRDLVERLADKFALTAIRSVIDSSHHELFEVELETTFSSSRVPVVVHEKRVRIVAPWKYIVPETDTPGLRPMQQLLLGVALMIKRAPAQARTRSFAIEVERWQSVAVFENSTEAESAQREMHEARVHLDGPKAIERQTRIARIDTKPVLADEEIEALDIERKTSFTERAPSQVDSSYVDTAITVDPEIPRVEESPCETPAENDSPFVETEPAPQPFFAELDESLTIETGLGGFFYLINLAIFLDIYSDFTSPVETFTELNIWEFVTLVGSELNEQENRDDPIWLLLSDLAGCEKEDFSRKGAEAQRKTSGDAAKLNAFAPLREDTLIWLFRLMPYIRRRLQRALNTTDFSKVLLRHHARITITATHIDVFFSLAELPIEIRLAGLDRDPGWVPAAGRFIAFHYE